MSNTLPQILEDCRVVAQNAQSDIDIKTAITPYYSEEQLVAGSALYTEVLGLFGLQKKEQQELAEATDKYIEHREIAEQSYIRLIKFCRVAFRNNNGLESMIPSVISLSPFNKWLLLAHNLYSTIKGSSAAMQALARYQFTDESMQGMIDELNVLEQFKNAKEAESGEAQQATKDRNAKLEELKDYCRDLVEIAKIALSDKPQLLEKLGVLVRS